MKAKIDWSTCERIQQRKRMVAWIGRRHCTQFSKRKCMKFRISQPLHELFFPMFTGLVLTLTACVSMAAFDTTDNSPHALAAGQKDPQIGLQDLVRAEAALALTQMQQRDTPGFHSTAGVSKPGNRNEVRAIFGVGNHLHAELVLSSKPYLFVSGRARPLEGPDRQWKLQRIQPPCIHLSHEGRPTVLCLGASIE